MTRLGHHAQKWPRGCETASMLRLVVRTTPTPTFCLCTTWKLQRFKENKPNPLLSCDRKAGVQPSATFVNITFATFPLFTPDRAVRHLQASQAQNGFSAT